MADLSPIIVDKLLAISRSLAGHIDPGSAFRATAAEISTLIPHDHMDVAVLLHDGLHHACYETGLHTNWSKLADHPLPTDVSPVRLVFRGEAPYLITSDALTDERFHFAGAFDEPIFAAQLRSRIIVPMRVRGKIVGTLNISRHQANDYSTADVGIAQHCADFIAPYIYALSQAEEARRAMLAETEARNREELLRVGASRLTEGMEHERRRMAMDLHDQTLADLARVMRQVSTMRSQGFAGPTELASLEREISICLTELRRIVDDMQPGVLELFGLRDAVEAHLNRSVGTAKPPIAIRIADTSAGEADALSGMMRTALYRIVQEAINNAVRHSTPSLIEVKIEAIDSELRIIVTDDGRGYEPTDLTESGGISHMRTRAALVGASFSIGRVSRKGGTRVAVEINRGIPNGVDPSAEQALAGGPDVGYGRGRRQPPPGVCLRHDRAGVD